MNKFIKGAVVAGLALSIGGTGLVATSAQAHAASAQLVDNTAKINALIQEKQELINRKKVSRDPQEQKALGIRIGEIEREIKVLKKGGSTGSTTTPTTPGEDTASKINALIQEKQELINKKKVSTDWQEQKALGLRISEIEREIQALKSGNTTSGSTDNTTPPSTPGEDNAAKINALIQEKQELVNKKKSSRDKNEQKALGKQIDQIEKEIKQLKKNK
ncbi:hypothetical protein UAY_03166 [Enterococcus moraviensis ATCC BAA-383]|uniref:Uncharacterized protein n=1 Tax=Enterococcus moraviensis ATCC BAA-383 TaxID=1158609 RepID=R2SKP3_9ENTE|nr:hypothetical protein [Enterococcus moraviensis]EOH95740.1 hypothetical protein UAY_03166 [Enterococcus moraviensis ATCC BAA-383]EOT66227.1 hypothetical protein I586_02498 [Enterococcus moraviensis ATCC BAA-383]OJG67707.1 hypothetical protein RV09_GL002476 [Enterococcus moraviensis]